MQQGDFVWYELCTTDPVAAAAFYTRVVGWKSTSTGVSGIDYTILATGERPAAGIMALPPERMPPRPTWFGYIAADDVDAKAAEIEAAGGRIHKSPEDIPTVGRFAVVIDPQGAVFQLFKGLGEPPPPPAAMQTGSVGWHELHSGEWEKGWPFYQRMFGWTKDAALDMEPMGTYQIFKTSGPPCGGMLSEPGSPAAYWLFYFVVDDIDAGIDRVTGAGGKLLFGPTEVPGGAWVIHAEDPQGGIFALVGTRKH